MKILLINPTIRENAKPYNFPAGLGIIAAIMVREGHEIEIYDQNAMRASNDVMFNDLRKLKDVDVIGIGGLITTYKRVKSIVPVLREIYPSSTIVVGGGLTIEPEMIFKYIPEADFCVHGEGEHTFRELCSALERREKDFSGIAGISYPDVDDYRLVITAPREIERDLDRFPMPAYDIFPSEIYFNNNVLKNAVQHDCDNTMCASLLWSRGCPNKCTFCWRMMGKTMRFRSVGLVMAEIGYLRSKYGVDSYLFYDECINANKRRSMEFAENLIEKGYVAPWYSHARVTNFDEELADTFSRSGCIGLNFGIESGSRKMLAAMNKNTSPEVAGEALAIAHKAGIRPTCTFIIGMPGETKETIRESVEWILRYGAKRYTFFFATPYPGTDLYNEPHIQKCIEQQYDSKDSFYAVLGDASDLCLNMTGFTDSQLYRLRWWAINKANTTGFSKKALSFIRRLLLLMVQPQRWVSVLKEYSKLIKSS